MTRYYEVDGERYVSVTSVLEVIRKPALERWRGKHGNAEADRLSTEATDLGTRLHALLEGVNRGQHSIASSDPLWPMVGAYLEFGLRIERVLAVEQRVVCRCHRYAGTADAVLQLRGHDAPVLVDYKTSRAAWPEYGFQLAAYRHALRCDLGIETDSRRLVLRFDKERPGVLEEHWYDDDRRDFRAFLAASIVWYTLNPDAATGPRPVLSAAITPGGIS